MGCGKSKEQIIYEQKQQKYSDIDEIKDIIKKGTEIDEFGNYILLETIKY